MMGPVSSSPAPVARRVTFLMKSAHGGGGVARTVTTLANALAGTHDVEVVSVFQRRDSPVFGLDERVRLTPLDDPDRRPPGVPAGLRARWEARPSALFTTPGSHLPVSAWTDHLLRRRVSLMRPGVLISTHPALHEAAARWSPPWVVRVAQDHLNYPVRSQDPTTMASLDAAARRLDAFVTLTHDDERDYRRRWATGRTARTRVTTVPNASPFAPALGFTPDPDSRVIISAGRLEERKGFDRVIRAFDPLRAEFPDWQLHIYGRGGHRGELRRLVAELGAGEQVRLQGFATDFEQVLAGGALYAMGSYHEGFPMVLLEAQASGLPIVSFDCPRGPADLVHDGVDGRLVVDHDLEGYTAALRQVMADASLRASMARAALRNAAHYQVGEITERWEGLLGELVAARPWYRRPRTTRPASRG